jgi:hypothetical protein
MKTIGIMRARIVLKIVQTHLSAALTLGYNALETGERNPQPAFLGESIERLSALATIIREAASFPW